MFEDGNSDSVNIAYECIDEMYIVNTLANHLGLELEERQHRQCLEVLPLLES
jgi:hypothetical protein